MDLRIQCLVVDAHDCARLATFWAEALGWRVTYRSPEEWALEPPSGSAADGVCADLLFVKVPDEKVVKNRLHLDLRPADQQAEVERLLALGASHADIGQSDVSWVVLQDPEDNEFCVLRALEDEAVSASGS
jgi:Glyoxalase-like domain